MESGSSAELQRFEGTCAVFSRMSRLLSPQNGGYLFIFRREFLERGVTSGWMRVLGFHSEAMDGEVDMRVGGRGSCWSSQRM